MMKIRNNVEIITNMYLLVISGYSNHSFHITALLRARGLKYWVSEVELAENYRVYGYAVAIRNPL
ncbi:hypothetical protein HCQ94_02345 [Actinomyces sp. zg-332]|uniref:hypothetical protein n=1 Tax=Actinomyces sp. zg-332 TaxID=2708340 RepID=UPI0014213102|nr:hypothetical protein [Actinomyces sp. zg-332]QPK94558.1 hypothetical protein HCQ94_02345 [Actinomyces sp. zg-332]